MGLRTELYFAARSRVCVCVCVCIGRLQDRGYATGTVRMPRGLHTRQTAAATIESLLGSQARVAKDGWALGERARGRNCCA